VRLPLSKRRRALGSSVLKEGKKRSLCLGTLVGVKRGKVLEEADPGKKAGGLKPRGIRSQRLKRLMGVPVPFMQRKSSKKVRQSNRKQNNPSGGEGLITDPKVSTTGEKGGCKKKLRAGERVVRIGEGLGVKKINYFVSLKRSRLKGETVSDGAQEERKQTPYGEFCRSCQSRGKKNPREKKILLGKVKGRTILGRKSCFKGGGGRERKERT